MKLLEEGPDFSMDRNQYLSTGGLYTASFKSGLGLVPRGGDGGAMMPDLTGGGWVVCTPYIVYVHVLWHWLHEL